MTALKLFSHIYVEREVQGLDKTESVLAAFPKAEVVSIESMTELTQRRSASWLNQKLSPKLILAKKHSDLVYPCSDVAPNFGHQNFYYAVPMQNCLYDCEYCYLQGMYNSAHLVYFLNQDDMIEACIAKAKELGSLYLCIAYDNDILALEPKFGVAREWIEGLREHSNILIEIRTKSANFRALRDLKASSGVILAWTLSPQSIVERFEQKTPSLKSRLQSMKEALDKSWRVRLCLDPLIPIKDWREHYGQMLKLLDEQDIWDQLEDVSFGLFRMPKPYLRQAKKARPDSALLHRAQEKEGRGLYTLSGTNQEDLLSFMEEALLERLPKQKVWRT